MSVGATVLNNLLIQKLEDGVNATTNIRQNVKSNANELLLHSACDKWTLANAYTSHASGTSCIIISGFEMRVALGTLGGVLRGLLSLYTSAASVMYFSHLEQQPSATSYTLIMYTKQHKPIIIQIFYENLLAKSDSSVKGLYVLLLMSFFLFISFFLALCSVISLSSLSRSYMSAWHYQKLNFEPLNQLHRWA